MNRMLMAHGVLGWWMRVEWKILFILLICSIKETLTAILSTVNFFFTGYRVALVLWALGSPWSDLCIWRHSQQQHKKTTVAQVVNTERFWPVPRKGGEKRWKVESSQRWNLQGLEPEFANSLELRVCTHVRTHTCTHTQQEKARFTPPQTFCVLLGMRLLTVP